MIDPIRPDERCTGGVSAADCRGGGRLRIGSIPLDMVRFHEALDRIEGLVAGGRGGAVYTPNVDHVVKAERDEAFRAAYENADLSLVDGMPLLWASRALGRPLPEKISGSDLVGPLAERAARRRWRLYLLGGAPGDADGAARVLSSMGVTIAGVESPWIDLGPVGEATARAAANRVREARTDLLFVGMGAPKQEIWIHRYRDVLRPAVAVGVGASFAFLAGTVSRAPRWMSRAGLEWSYRLMREPGRLWRRYLVEDVKFLPILLRSWRLHRRRSEGS